MATANLIGSYNHTLVALSVLIAMVASYAALDLVARVTASSGLTRAQGEAVVDIEVFDRI
jgi:NO-binding membrane sensor protein with MHYT domain